jgi:hypothetical protein
VSITTIILICGLITLLSVSFIVGENVILEVISYTFERSFEFSYCLAIVIVHWKNLKYMNTKKKDTQSASGSVGSTTVTNSSTPLNQNVQNTQTLQNNSNTTIAIGEG